MRSKQIPFAGLRRFTVFEDGLVWDSSLGRYLSQEPKPQYTLRGAHGKKVTYNTKCMVYCFFVSRIPLGMYPDFKKELDNYKPENLELKRYKRPTKLWLNTDNSIFYAQRAVRKHLEESLEKMRAAKRKRVVVTNIWTGEQVRFDSIADVCKQTKITRRTFNRRLISQKPLNGWIFKTFSPERVKEETYDPRPFGELIKEEHDVFLSR
jgi:hypothetical protein